MIGERSGEPVSRIALFGEPGNWDATLILNPVGNAERRAKIKALAVGLRRDCDLRYVTLWLPLMLTLLRRRRKWREEMRLAAEQMHALHGDRAYDLARNRVSAALKDGDRVAERHWNAISAELRRSLAGRAVSTMGLALPGVFNRGRWGPKAQNGQFPL